MHTASMLDNCTLHTAQSSFNLYYSNIQMYKTFSAKFNGSIKRGTETLSSSKMSALLLTFPSIRKWKTIVTFNFGYNHHHIKYTDLNAGED